MFWIFLVLPIVVAFNFEDLNLGDQPCAAVPCPSSRPFSALKENFEYTVNGCGTDMIQVKNDNIDFTECCNLHDACYGICGMKKKTCERRFEKCMTALCAAKKEQDTREAFEECESSKNMYVFGVKMMGCPAYQKAQQGACQCVSKKEKALAMSEKHVRQYLAGKNDVDVEALLAKYNTVAQRAVLMMRLIVKFPSSLVHVESAPGTAETLFSAKQEQGDVEEHIEL